MNYRLKTNWFWIIWVSVYEAQPHPNVWCCDEHCCLEYTLLLVVCADSINTYLHCLSTSVSIDVSKYNVTVSGHSAPILETVFLVVSSYKESRNNMPIYSYVLPNLSTECSQ